MWRDSHGDYGKQNKLGGRAAFIRLVFLLALISVCASAGDDGSRQTEKGGAQRKASFLQDLLKSVEDSPDGLAFMWRHVAQQDAALEGALADQNSGKKADIKVLTGKNGEQVLVIDGRLRPDLLSVSRVLYGAFAGSEDYVKDVVLPALIARGLPTEEADAVVELFDSQKIDSQIAREGASIVDTCMANYVSLHRESSSIRSLLLELGVDPDDLGQVREMLMSVHFDYCLDRWAAQVLDQFSLAARRVLLRYSYEIAPQGQITYIPIADLPYHKKYGIIERLERKK